MFLISRKMLKKIIELNIIIYIYCIELIEVKTDQIKYLFGNGFPLIV